MGATNSPGEAGATSDRAQTRSLRYADPAAAKSLRCLIASACQAEPFLDATLGLGFLDSWRRGERSCHQAISYRCATTAESATVKMLGPFLLPGTRTCRRAARPRLP